MTVKELINELQKVQNKNADAIIFFESTDDLCPNIFLNIKKVDPKSIKNNFSVYIDTEKA